MILVSNDEQFPLAALLVFVNTDIFLILLEYFKMSTVPK